MAGSLLVAASGLGDGAAGSGEVRRSLRRDPEATEATAAAELQFLPAVIAEEEGEDGKTGTERDSEIRVSKGPGSKRGARPSSGRNQLPEGVRD